MRRNNRKNLVISSNVFVKYIAFSLLLFFINTPITYGYSIPLETGNNNYGYPFLIYNEPAGICKQNGLPIGFSFFYNYISDEYSYVTGFSESFTKAAYAIAYSKNYYDYINKFTSAVSFSYKKLTFGASFHFLFPGSEPSFVADGGARLHFNEKKYIGILFNNLVFSDTLNGINYRGLTLSTGGDIPWINEFYYNLQGILKVCNFVNLDYWKYDYEYGGNLNIEKFLFNNPSLSISLSGNMLYNRQKTIEWGTSNSLGFHYSFNKFAVGLYLGYEYNGEPLKSQMALSFYINPLYIKEIPMLSCDISLSNSYFTPNADGDNDNALIYFKGCFSNEKVKAKKWVILISENNTPKSSITKVFSGGNIPPSTLLWGGRDSKGDLVKEGVYYIRLIVFDTMNRVVTSNYKKVELR